MSSDAQSAREARILSRNKQINSPLPTNNNAQTKILEQRLTKQIEDSRAQLVKQLEENNAQLRSTVMETHAKLEDFNQQLKSTILEAHNKLLDTLDNIVKDFNNRFEDINRSMSALSVRLEVLEQTSESVLCSQLAKEVFALQGKIDEIEREKLTTDAILHGVPSQENENLHMLYTALCASIDCTPAPLPKQIFRTKAKRNSQCPAIIVKFSSVADKIKVLKSVNYAYKKTKKTLCLHNLGMQSDLTESLSPANHAIYRKAFQLKHHKHLTSVFTRGGRVYVRVKPNEEAFLVDHIQRLDALTAAAVATNDELAPINI